MAISYTPPSTSNLIGNPSEGGSFSDPASAAELQSTVSSAAAAKVSETAALASKNAAATSETNALASKNAAATSETNALASKNAAATSETAAELAETNAETAETNAETAETNALAYKNAAASSSTTASNAANAATASQAASAASQISAISSENASNANASNASSSAGAASTSATASATSATASATSATASETSRVASVAAKDLAEDWATKTSSAVEGSNFSAKYYSTVGNVPTVAGSIANVNTVGTNISNVNTVGGISGNVTTVAGIASNVTTVADIDSNVTTAAGIASNITTVAGISGNVTTVAGINQTHLSNVSGSIADINTVASANSNITAVVANATNITSVAGNASNINTVAANSTNISSAVANATNINSAVANATNINSAVANATNISTVASNISSVNNFSDVYRIASSAPTSSLTAGDLYFDTSSDILKVYGASGWQSAGSSVNGTSARFAYTLTANQTTVTGNDQSGNSLLYDAGFLDVYLNGVKLHSNDFTASSGSSIVLAAGATANDILEVVAFGTFSLSDGTFPGTSAMGTITVTGTIDGRDVATDGTKLDTIETSATADQTDAEIRAAVEAASDSNVFTDADHSKLNAIEASATADQTDAEIRAAVEAASDSNVFTDADHTKLDAIEASATADQTKSDIEGLGIDLPAANLTGTVAAARLDTATTQAESDDSTKIATTAYVVDKITTLIGGAPSTLNDLNELAAAINDDADYNSTLTTALGTKMPKAGGAFTGAVTTNSTFDGVDIATRDAVLTSTTTTANAALPKSGGTVTGLLTSGTDVGINSEYLVLGDDTSNRQLKLTQYQTGGANNNAGHKINASSGYGELALAVGGTTRLLTTTTGIDVTGNMTAKGYLASEASNSTNKWLAYTHTDNTLRLNYNGAGNDEVVIDSSGRLGIGVTPSAYGSSVKVVQLANAAVYGVGQNAYLAANNYFDGSNNRYIATDEASRLYQAAGAFVFESAASGSAGAAITFSEKMRVAANGNVGIGVSPSQKLHVYSSGQAVALVEGVNAYQTALMLKNNYSSVQSQWHLAAAGGTSGWGNVNGNFIIRDDTTNSTGIEIERGAGGASGALYITSAGNVGLGLSATGQIGATLHVDPETNVTTAFGAPLIKVGGANSWAGNGSLYSIGFGYNAASAHKAPAEIGLVTTSSSGATFGDLVFATRSDYSSSTAPTERMRIDSSGNVHMMKTSSSLATAGHTFGSDGYTHHTRNGNIIHLNQLASSGNALTFFQAAASKGSIAVTTTGTTYNTTSDRRLKENIQPIADATDKLMAMKPVTHTWIANPEADAVHGFIAQEMQEIVPEAVSGDADSEEMMSMDYGRITPVLVAALQEATNEIKALKQRVSELEAI